MTGKPEVSISIDDFRPSRSLSGRIGGNNALSMNRSLVSRSVLRFSVRGLLLLLFLVWLRRMLLSTVFLCALWISCPGLYRCLRRSNTKTKPSARSRNPFDDSPRPRSAHREKLDPASFGEIARVLLVRSIIPMLMYAKAAASDAVMFRIVERL
jgi:hypothetical protein